MHNNAAIVSAADADADAIAAIVACDIASW